MSDCVAIFTSAPLTITKDVDDKIYGDLRAVRGEEPVLKFCIGKKSNLRLGWVIHEEIGVVMINDCAVTKIEVA